MKARDEENQKSAASVAKLEKENLKLQQEQIKLKAELQEALDGNCRIMKAMQNNLTPAQIDRLLYNKRTQWSSQDYESAIILLGISSKGYQYTRLHYKYPLPCVSAVKRYLSKIHFEPGELNLVFALMEYLGATLSEIEKFVIVTFDEMYLRKVCAYDPKNDVVIGPCNQVQVVNVRSLFGAWKNPIFFNFDTPMTPEIYNSLVKRLHKAGFTVVANVSDSASTNKKFFKDMGCTLTSPVFKHPETQMPIVCLHDPPHNVKLCRNHLLDKSIRLNPNQEPARVATKSCLLELVQLTCAVDGPPHDVRIEHLTVKGSDRQHVGRAVQVLSPRTGNSLISAGKSGLLKSTDYQVNEILSPKCSI